MYAAVGEISATLEYAVAMFHTSTQLSAATKQHLRLKQGPCQVQEQT